MRRGIDQTWIGLSLLIIGVWCLGTVLVASAAEPGSQERSGNQERFEKQMGPEGNPIGVPEPGSVQDLEPTTKKRDPNKVESPESTRQITIGGAQYFVEGEVLKIEADQYTIRKDETGEQ